MKAVTYFTLAFILFFPLRSVAAYEITPGCEKALEQILNLQTVSARATLKEESILDKDNHYIIFLENYADIIELLANGNKAKYQKFLIRLDDRLNAMEEENPLSPYYRAIRAEMLAQAGMINILFGDYLSGFSKIYSANHLLAKNCEIFPSFRMNNKLSGAFNIAFDNIPPVFKWVTRLMGMKGNTRKGFALIENYRAYVKGHHGLEPESHVYIIFAYKIISEEEKAMHTIQAQRDPAYSTLLSDYLYVNLLYKNAQAEESIKLLSMMRQKKTEVPFIYINYLYGKAKLSRLDDDADRYFLAFLKESGEINYKKEICNLLSWHYLIHGSTDKYIQYRNRIKGPEAEVTDRDREALVESQRKYSPNISLLKTRLLISGGYSNQAEETLKKVSPSQLESAAFRTEYYLLWGELYSGRQNFQKAFGFFDLSIRQGADIPEHYASEASLLAGLLALKINRPDLAKRYFKIALSLHNTDNVYLEVIHKRAKQALIRLS
ncbi:MAG: hypothetical protein Q8867_04700 [Bacteroidota bacterium]|nr:hypothetical protein [Bacteroidota bacterium]